MRVRIVLLLLFAAAILFLSTTSFAQVGVSIRIGPPPLPVYEQPISPATVISGRLGIGLGMATITGYRAHG